MVEMTETAAILNTATPQSLILLDEVGRGTATYDGLAIAWAAVEYLHARTRAKTLFATHYFELTELGEQLSGVKNYHVAVKETGGGIVFLRTVDRAAGRGYGSRSELAGAEEVVRQAREVLAEHENRGGVEARASWGFTVARGATYHFYATSPVLELLQQLDIDFPLTLLDCLTSLGRAEEASRMTRQRLDPLR
jgi:DNA mismatch repair protein MutS